MIRPPPSPTLFPYTTLFRSGRSILLQYRFLVAMQGALGIGANLNRWSPEDSALAAKMITLYKHIRPTVRSEEHTSELQSRGHLVCRLLLEKKKMNSRVTQHC